MHSRQYLELTPFCRALQESVSPFVIELSINSRQTGWDLLNKQLELKLQKNKAILRQIKVYLLLIRIYSWVLYLSPFEKLNVTSQTKILSAFRDSKFTLIRTGFWGITTLLKISVYGLPEAQMKINYRPMIANPRTDRDKNVSL